MQLDPLRATAFAYAIILVVGVVAGCRGRITVFEDLSDLITTFTITAGSAVLAFLLMNVTSGWVANELVIMAAATIIAASAITYLSWRHNRSVIATALAVLTKMPFALGVPLLVIQAIAPTGQTAAQRAGKRASALLLLTILTPLILALVRDKDGLRRYLRVA